MPVQPATHPPALNDSPLPTDWPSSSPSDQQSSQSQSDLSFLAHHLSSGALYSSSHTTSYTGGHQRDIFLLAHSGRISGHHYSARPKEFSRENSSDAHQCPNLQFLSIQ